LGNSNGKIRQESNLVNIVKIIILYQKLPHLLELVFTSLVDIKKDDILELDQWNHLDILDVQEIMHQTCLDMIMINLGG
jgi:hypothetical protein